MKVYINNYRNHWISPYTILKAVCFWEKDGDRIYNIDEKPNNPYVKWVNFLNPICTKIQKILDIVHLKINYVKIDRWDTWSMDHTLAYIILPMLKQLKEASHSAPRVDDVDVPQELHSYVEPSMDAYSVDGKYFERWDWVLGEMIFAFEHKLDGSWQDQFSSGQMDTYTRACEWDEDGKPILYEMVNGPKHTYECDYEGIEKVQKRISNGFRLFGKYYEGLWD